VNNSTPASWKSLSFDQTGSPNARASASRATSSGSRLPIARFAVSSLAEYSSISHSRTKLCLQNLRKHVVLLGENRQILPDFVQDPLRREHGQVGAGEDLERSVAQDRG
jgi:hypothetical protein